MMKNLIDTSKPLKIENENNKFSLKNFIQIHFGPPRFGDNGFYGGLIGKTFYIDYDGNRIFVKLIDYEIIQFLEITDSYTLQCSGLDAYNWKFNFMTKYPSTRNNTRMAIYVYEKIDLTANSVP